MGTRPETSALLTGIQKDNTATALHGVAQLGWLYRPKICVMSGSLISMGSANSPGLASGEFKRRLAWHILS